MSSVQKTHISQSKNTSGERNVIGRYIRAARKKHKPSISQEDLAARLVQYHIYMDRSAISRMEAQKRYIRDYEIIAIAKCLKLPIQQLFNYKEISQ